MNQDCFKYEYPDKDDYGEHDNHFIIDICSFLDSILDDSFNCQLETHVTFPGTEPNPELVITIAKQTPELQKLKLNFQFYRETCIEKVETLMGSLSSLEHLTHLTLLSCWELKPTVWSVVGKCCPVLTHLNIFGGNPVGNQEILSLILGAD